MAAVQWASLTFAVVDLEDIGLVLREVVVASYDLKVAESTKWPDKHQALSGHSALVRAEAAKWSVFFKFLRLENRA